MAGLAYTPPAATEVNEVQVVTVDATSGSFKLSFGGQQTGAIAENAPAAAVQTALRALSSIGGANVAVSGSDGGPYTVTFQNDLGEQNVAQMTADSTLLAGGTHTATVTTTQQGSA